MRNTQQVTCGKCKTPLPVALLNTDSAAPCPSCRTPFRAEVFPAWFAENLIPTTNTPLLNDSEAGCFYHPQKKASVVCEGCGRFICGLCDVELNDRHLCPACLESGRKKKKIRNLENERTIYSSMASSLAILGLIVWPITLFTAPAALYIVIRHWNSPGSLIPRSRFRFILAAFFALAEISGWAFLFYYLIPK